MRKWAGCTNLRNPYLTYQLVKIAGIPPHQSSLMSAEAHKFYIEDKPLAEIISKVGSITAVQLTTLAI